MLKDKNFLQNLNWVEEISDDSASMIEGGVSIVLIRDVGPARAGPPPKVGERAIFGGLPPANPTALQITNGTDVNLSYGLNFDAPNASSNLSISPGAVQEFLGRDPIAVATWDISLLQPGLQPISQDLESGRRYEFYAAVQ